MVASAAMLETVARPLPPRSLALAAGALLAANTIYCLLYTTLAGRPEPLGQAIGWSVANILPWLAAFEAGKRHGTAFAPTVGGLALSLLLGMLLLGAPPTLFEASRRLPGALLILGVLLALHRRRVATAAGPVELPLPPERIAWVAAAGNYVELHGSERPLLIRAPIGALEAALAPHGFVRIHRSTLVNRSRVARVRSTDLLLDDGRSLKLGPSFRARLHG
jgi:hypothetical protein